MGDNLAKIGFESQHLFNFFLFFLRNSLNPLILLGVQQNKIFKKLWKIQKNEKLFFLKFPKFAIFEGFFERKNEKKWNFGEILEKGGKATAKGRLKPPTPMSLRGRKIKNAANYDVS